MAMSPVARHPKRGHLVGEPPLPPYRDFAYQTDVVSRIDQIDSFSYHVRYQQTSGLTDPSGVDGILSNLTQSILGVLERTGIHSAHHLEGKIQAARSPSTRLDDEKAIATLGLTQGVYNFQLQVYDDRLVVRREASSFRDFYNWYRLFMPEFQSVELALRRHIERSAEQRMQVVEALYRFRFNFSDFSSRAASRPRRRARNVDVLEELIPRIPAMEGSSDLSEQDFYRLDLTLSRLEDLGKGGNEARRRNCWYILEAPFNETGRFLVFEAQVRNSSLRLLSSQEVDDADDARTIPIDGDLGGDVRLSMIDFLKNRALEGFMGRLLQHWDFETQRRL